MSIKALYKANGKDYKNSHVCGYIFLPLHQIAQNFDNGYHFMYKNLRFQYNI